MHYEPDYDRYNQMVYRSCGKSGLKLPVISFGLWHNFSREDGYDGPRQLIRTAFDLGITHFDIANVYGAGYSEEVFGRILKDDFSGYRDEMIISTKAGFYMWPGPYGEWGSRKHILASIDQSLKRLGLDYVDVFYSHRPDPDTPLEETALALDKIVRDGKALYVGISNYSKEATKEMVNIFKSLRTPFILHQPKYSMYHREPEEDLFPYLEEAGVGTIVYSPLAQGLLTDRYLDGIPEDSRAGGKSVFLKEENITEETLERTKKLLEIAKSRNQTLAQLALSWVLRKQPVTSALIGASKPEQIVENVQAVKNLSFSEEELTKIEQILAE